MKIHIVVTTLLFFAIPNAIFVGVILISEHEVDMFFTQAKSSAHIQLAGPDPSARCWADIMSAL